MNLRVQVGIPIAGKINGDTACTRFKFEAVDAPAVKFDGAVTKTGAHAYALHLLATYLHVHLTSAGVDLEFAQSDITEVDLAVTQAEVHLDSQWNVIAQLEIPAADDVAHGQCIDDVSLQLHIECTHAIVDTVVDARLQFIEIEAELAVEKTVCATAHS